MVATPLVEPLKDAGKRLLDELDAINFPIQAAFWMYFSEPAEWRLVIASDRVSQRGLREAYAEVQGLVRDRYSELRLPDISLRESDDALVKVMRSAIKRTKEASGIRLTGITLSGIYIDDAYIYRLAS
jgi:hypothetical protein